MVIIMRQIGIITKTNETTAEISVRRLSACDGCHKANPGMQTDDGVVYASCHECSMFPTETALSVTAENPIGAAVGDRVVIESSSQLILLYAAAVFLLPLLLAAVLGVAFAAWMDAVWSPYLGAVVGFVGAFVLVKLIFDRHALTHTTHTIIKRL